MDDAGNNGRMHLLFPQRRSTWLWIPGEGSCALVPAFLIGMFGCHGDRLDRACACASVPGGTQS